MGASTVSIDLQDLEFIDCAALSAIVDADARRDGGRLILERGSGQVDRVLALTGLLEQIEVAELRLSAGPVSSKRIGGWALSSTTSG